MRLQRYRPAQGLFAQIYVGDREDDLNPIEQIRSTGDDQRHLVFLDESLDFDEQISLVEVESHSSVGFFVVVGLAENASLRLWGDGRPGPAWTDG